MIVCDEEYAERQRVVDSGTSPFTYVNVQEEIEYLQKTGLYDAL